MSGPTGPAKQSGIMLKLFGRTLFLTGRSAAVVVLTVLGLVAALVIYYAIENPESARSALLSPLWLSAGLWILMIVYWSGAAWAGTGAGPSRSRSIIS